MHFSIHSFVQSFTHQIVQQTSYLQDTGAMTVLKKQNKTNKYESLCLSSQVIHVQMQTLMATRIPRAVYQVSGIMLST